MSDTPPPIAKTKRNLLVQIAIFIFGIFAIVSGILQVTRGLASGKVNPEVERLAKESDSAFNQANRLLEQAGPIFQSLLDSVDKEGLEAVRAGKKDEAAKVASLYEQAAEQFRQAARTADLAAALVPSGHLPVFLKTKYEAYLSFAAARDINRDIARMVLDKTIKTADELVPKVMEAAARRDKLEVTANEAVARADKVLSDSKK